MSGRRKDWCDQNIAQRLTFSSFTSNTDEQFGAEAIKRPYRVMALEGYEVPPGLDRDSKDALWLDMAPGEPTAVWDGYCSVALYEVIYECFGFRPGEVAGKIAVVDSDGRLVEDPRSQHLLKFRPQKPFGLSRTGYRNHVGDLYAWAAMVGGPTLRLYDDLFTSALGGETNNAQTVDSKKFWSFYRRRDEFAFMMRRTPLLRRGPGSFADGGDGEILRDLGHSVRSELVKNALCADEIEANGAPSSFYEAFLPPRYDSRSGELIGARADMEAKAAEVRGWSDLGKDTEEEEDRSAGPAVQADSFITRIMKKARGF